MANDHSVRSRWVRAANVGVAALLAASLLPITPAGAAETGFTFTGGGYGHSVGLSQFGAYGMALEGFGWADIMSHYFTVAAPGAVDPAMAARPLWVNLQVEQSAVSFTPRATGTAPTVPVVISSTAGTVNAGAGETVTITRS